MNSKRRAYLKKLAHAMRPVIQVGKEGVSPALVDQVAETIKKRELIKISLLESMPEELKEAAEKITERTRSEFVSLVGRKLTIYKRNEQEPVIEFPRGM